MRNLLLFIIKKLKYLYPFKQLYRDSRKIEFENKALELDKRGEKNSVSGVEGANIQALTMPKGRMPEIELREMTKWKRDKGEEKQKGIWKKVSSYNIMHFYECWSLDPLNNL